MGNFIIKSLMAALLLGLLVSGISCETGNVPVTSSPTPTPTLTLTPKPTPKPTPTPTPLSTIALSRSSVILIANEGQSNPSSRIIDIVNAGVGRMDWTATGNATWLNISPVSGFSTGECNHLTVSVSSYGMIAGNYSARITISAPAASNTPQIIPVSLTIYQVATVTETLRPMADGNFADLTPMGGDARHYTKVDEVKADDWTTNVFNHSPTAKLDTYRLSYHLGNSGKINSVTVHARVNVYDGDGFAEVALFTKSGLYYGEEIYIPHPFCWWEIYEVWTVNPETQNPWTWDEINALEAGILLKGAEKVTEESGAFCTQVYVEVNYTPSLAP